MKALLYTSAEAMKMKPLPFDLTKEDFLNKVKDGLYDRRVNYEYSEALGNWVISDVFLVNNIKVSCLFFEDGSCYEVNKNDFRTQLWNDADFVKAMYEKLCPWDSELASQLFTLQIGRK